MSRWKAPRKPSSPYITAAGYHALEQELKALWEKRKGVVSALADAAAEGDRSENAEYIYRKKELRGIDGRIHFLQKRMPRLNIITTLPQEPHKIFFSAWVVLENSGGEREIYRIVGADEFEMDTRYISLDAPLAKALLKKSVGDEVQLQLVEKHLQYRILEVHYGADFSAEVHHSSL